MSAKPEKTGGGGGEVVVLGKSERRLLTAVEFQGLSDVPPEAEWFANLSNPRTRRAYKATSVSSWRSWGLPGQGSSGW